MSKTKQENVEVETVAVKEIEYNVLDHIKAGMRVTIVNRFNQHHTGTAVMRGPAGWVLNMGGRHGTPGIADERNIVHVPKLKYGKKP